MIYIVLSTLSIIALLMVTRKRNVRIQFFYASFIIIAGLSACVEEIQYIPDEDVAEIQYIPNVKEVLHIPAIEKVVSKTVWEKGLPSFPAVVRDFWGKSRSYAVIIGIDKYTQFKNGYNPLPYAQKDAREVRNYLIKYLGFSVDHIYELYDEDATKRKIEKILGDELPTKLREKDRLLVYFSGHGDTAMLANGEKFGYLIPSDGEKESLYSTSLSMKQLSDYSDLIQARQILFVVDSCYSGIAGVINKGSENELSELTEKQVKLFMEKRGRQILTAGGKDEKSRMGKTWGEHSVFTYYLLKGLKEFKDADYNNDGVIAVNELELYVSTKVSHATKGNQNPQLYKLGDTEGQFIFYREGDM